VCVCTICLIYPIFKAHAPYYIVIYGLSGCGIFFKIISQRARFSGEKEKSAHTEKSILTFYTKFYLKYFSFFDHVRNEEVLLRVKEQRNIPHEISKRKANWIGHILRRNCLLQQVIEGKLKGG
jgi:hypothetical protein